MHFRKMSQEMTGTEITMLFEFLFPHATLLTFERHVDVNYISVNYFWGEDISNTFRMDFLPDDIYVINNDRKGKEKLLQGGDTIYKYRQFMISKGYSEMWTDNPFLT